MTKKYFLSVQNQVSDISSSQVGLDLELFTFPEMELLALPGGISGEIEQGRRDRGGNSLMETPCVLGSVWGSLTPTPPSPHGPRLQKVAFGFTHKTTEAQRGKSSLCPGTAERWGWWLSPESPAFLAALSFSIASGHDI
jgi:hypothetical protein